MKLTLAKTIKFIPKFNGNKELPADEQISVTIDNPSLATKDKITEHPEARAKTDKKGTISGMDIVLKIDQFPIVKAMVHSIENLEYELDGKVVEITNAAELIAAPADLSPLFTEIANECERILKDSEIDEKN